MHERFDPDREKKGWESHLGLLVTEEKRLRGKLNRVLARKKEMEILLARERSHAPGGKGKVMVRGIIKQVLMEADGLHMDADEVVFRVQMINELASPEAIKRSLGRLTRDSNSFSAWQDEDEVTVYEYTGGN
jgi:hypothetical protein